MVRTKIFGRKTFVSGTREFVYIYKSLTTMTREHVVTMGTKQYTKK